MRLILIFIGLAVFFTIPFLIWGPTLEATYSQEGTVAWLQGYQTWAWLAGITLLLLDFVLPIPGTAVMSGLGFVYGPVWGGIIGSGGSILTGLTAYGFCRLLGPRAAIFLLGETDYHRGIRLFANAGGWIIVISRWLPLLPEVVACMAGLTRMPFSRFILALACGSVPLSFGFAYIGHAGSSHPATAILLSAGIPPLLWLFARRLLKKHP